MTIHNIQLRLQLSGQQATQQMQRLNLQQSQAQQQQKQNLNQILQTQNRLNASVQQGGRYGQQQMRTGQSMVQTNRLLAQILQQQQRSSSLIGQQLQQQQRSYQMQLNTLRSQVREAERLRQQLQQAGQAQRDNQRNSSGGGNLIGGAAGAVAGVAAGGMIVNGVFRPAISYDEQLSRMSVIAANGKGAAEMRRLKPDLRKTVDSAALSGGSALQDTAAALGSLLNRGKYSYEEAKAILPTISEAAYAGDTSAVGMSVLADSLATYGMKGQKDLQKGFAMALKSGELGGFELKDMQSDLARQLGLATLAGYSGEAGLASLLTSNQISMDVSGNASEAGNNVVNALQKLGSRELSDSMAKAVTNTDGLATSSIYNKKGKYVGEEFDWNKQLQVGRQQGKFGLEVLGDVIDHQLESNSDYQSLKKQTETASGDDKKKLLSDMTNIVLGGEIGQIIADRQFLMSAVAETLARNNVDKNSGNRIDDIKNQTLKAERSDVIGPTVEFLNGQPFGKEGTAKTSAQIVRQDSFDRVAGGYGTALDKFSEITQQFPAFSQGLLLSTTALTALSASAGLVALAMRRGQPPIPPVGGGLGGKVGTVSLAAGQVALSGALGYAIGTEIRDMYMQTEAGQKFDKDAGEFIAQTLALFGNDEAQAALDNNAKYEQMIAQQEQANKLSSDLSNKLSTLITATQNNKPIPFNTGSLLDGISNHAKAESNRHGAPPAYMLIGK
ncbi:phage tail tape measure protein [Acinetobacter bohemicus]|uniref:phage tail tape measure protein n=1 Tax=Acinetobacter bohemicus TaxID=1435036 RepID=UPI00192AB3BB|nr:phage tail tape measure protein [Acinetobacter bohemicus]CAD9194018.1 hypothetical protein QAC21B_00103 [Acinetobacter bohemicus]